MRTEVLDKVYCLQRGCGVHVTGAETPVGKIIDDTLGSFAVQDADADLTLVLGEFPSEKWAPTGFTVGDRLLYDSMAGSTSIFRSPTSSSLSKLAVEYVVYGDIRDPRTPVKVFVPVLREKMGYLRSIRRGLARVSLSRTLLAAIGSNYVAMEQVESEAAKLRLAILEPFLYYRLPFVGSTLIHGSVVSSNGSGLLFTGGGHIGKTALALEMVKRGFAYLGDDLAIVTGEGKALPYPEPIRIQEQHLDLYPELRHKIASRMGTGERILFKLMIGRNKGETLELLPRLGISEIFDGAKVGEQCRIDNALLLQKGTVPEPKLEEIDRETISRTVAAELFWEFETGHWRHNQYIYAPSSARGSDFLGEEADHRRRIRSILDDSFSGIKSYRLLVPYEFRISDASVFVDKILSR